ncbi:MAG: hypothetical protein IKI29_03835 [Clostridia bacterium]|nr:hypothetical protein [Clostridia bacterium]
MKKLFAVGLCLMLVCALTACGRDAKKPEDGLDVAYFAKLGQIPETEYRLGMDIEKLKADLSAKAEEAGEEGFYDLTEGEQTVRISTDQYSFYYEKGHEEKGIACIVCLDGGFGFPQNSVTVEVTEQLSAYEGKEHPATEEETFFLPFAQDTTCISYTFGEYVLNFVFQENALCGIVLYDPQYWAM